MSSLNLLDLSPHLETAEFRKLLLFLVGWHDDEAANRRAADQAIQNYRTRAHLHPVGIEENGHLAGLIGLELVTPGGGILYQIVVHPAFRGRGLGSRMIRVAIERLQPHALEPSLHHRGVLGPLLEGLIHRLAH